jgi:hypothetical protein
MAMPSNKTRKIVVDGVEYRWACSESWEPKADREAGADALGLSLTVETTGETTTRLFDRATFPTSVMAGDCYEPGVVIQPRHVAAVIKQARDSGWAPETDLKHITVNYLRDIIISDDQCGAY